MTVAELKAALDAAGVEYSSTAVKAELEQLHADLPAVGTGAAPVSTATHRTDAPLPLIRSLAKRRQTTHR